MQQLVGKRKLLEPHDTHYSPQYGDKGGSKNNCFVLGLSLSTEMKAHKWLRREIQNFIFDRIFKAFTCLFEPKQFTYYINQ